MTGENLLSLLNAELNRIKRDAANKNIGLKFVLNTGKEIILRQDSSAKWLKNPEIMEGDILKIAENNESAISTETLYEGGTYIAKTTRPREINYIPVDSIMSFSYFYDTIEENELQLSGGDDEPNGE